MEHQEAVVTLNYFPCISITLTSQQLSYYSSYTHSQLLVGAILRQMLPNKLDREPCTILKNFNSKHWTPIKKRTLKPLFINTLTKEKAPISRYQGQIYLPFTKTICGQYPNTVMRFLQGTLIGQLYLFHQIREGSSSIVRRIFAMQLGGTSI